MSDTSFGQTIRKFDPDDILAAEAAAGRSERFLALDTLLSDLVGQAFAGHPVVELSYGKRGPGGTTIAIVGADIHRALLRNEYLLEAQEARGAWYLPQEASLKIGMVNLPSLITTQPRFSVNAARDQVAKIDFRANPDQPEHTV